LGNVEHTPEESAEIKRQYAEYCKQHEAEWKAEERKQERQHLGFRNAESDCSLVQFWRMSDWYLSSSTEMTPVFDGKCPDCLSLFCNHCLMYHNFVAKPAGLAHFCTVHNRRHESKKDLEQIVAEAEQRYIETEKAARGS